MNNLEWLDALGLDRTKLPQLPKQVPDESGQLKPHKDAMPEMPQHALTQKNDVRAENDISSLLEGVGRKTNSAVETDIQPSWGEGFLACWQMLLHAGLLVHPAQQAGQDCRGCRHIIMAGEHHEGSRRQFFWRCELAHRQLEMGLHGERIIVAPPECRDYELPQEKKWG